jgi:colanic acid/amylovoran biosynthesis protein
MRLILTGCNPMTGNLGVSALCYATLRTLFAELPEVDLSVTDQGWGMRQDTLTVDGAEAHYRRFGIRSSRRYWRSESLWNIRVSTWLGGLRNPAAKAICDADAVLDISGGDSFTDLYGEKRFRAISLVKKIALGVGCPLVLLPQTYGPFQDPSNRRAAQHIVREAAMAWARDPESFETLRNLAGADFDPARHRCGVDVAFNLESLPPRCDQPLKSAGVGKLIVGFNVSGLIYNGGATAARQYGFKADYRELVLRFMQKMLRETDCAIVLLPHVITSGRYEADAAACENVREALGPAARERVTTLASPMDPRHAKWVISRFDWFCGTRLHSTIAGLSSKVPTAAIAYSLKARGVFATCGVAENVVDLRHLTTDEAMNQLWEAWLRREQTEGVLAEKIPGVIAKATQQMRDIIAAIRLSANSPAAAMTHAAV